MDAVTKATASAGKGAKRADIQGLRAVAVLAVVIFHATPAALPGGFVGVDVFFVISGFLITGIILRPMEEGSFSLVDFYRRRIRRLYPALYLMTLVALGLGLLLFPPTLLNEYLESQLFTTIFVSNFYFLDKTDYFDLQAELMPLLHTWSLGVEEQFYLLFPPVLWLVHRFARPYLFTVLAILWAASLVASQRWVQIMPDVGFYHPASRAFELLTGSLAVGVARRWRPEEDAARAIAVLALMGLATSFIVIRADSPFPGLLALLPCLSAAALLVLTAANPARALLQAGPLVRIGDLSYSLYLWHWPLLVYARFVWPDSPLAVAAALVAAFVAAWASWRFVEEPVLRRPPRHHFVPAAAVMVGLTLGSLPIYLSGGWASRFSPEVQRYLAASNDHNPDRKACHMRSDRPIPYEALCTYGAESVPPSFAVWGDSHGTELALVLGRRLADRDAALRSITMSGCPATVTRGAVCRGQVASSLEAIRNDPAMQVVVLTSNIHGRDDFARATQEGIKETALALKEAGKTPVIVAPVPTFDFDPPSKLALDARAGRDLTKTGLPRRLYEARHGHIADEFRRFGQERDVTVVDPAAFLCDEDRCRAYDEDIGVLYYNQGHLSLTGATLLADAVLTALADRPRNGA